LQQFFERAAAANFTPAELDMIAAYAHYAVANLRLVGFSTRWAQR
jgi:hypothetical protein